MKKNHFLKDYLEYPQYTRPEVFEGERFQKYYYQDIMKI